MVAMRLKEFLLELSVNGANENDGICVLVRENFGEVVEIYVKNLMVQWPESTGRIDFPIPHPTVDPQIAFNNAVDLWANEYGDNRKKCCAWLAGKVK